MLRRGLALLFLVAALGGAALPLSALDVPFLAGRVNDQANLMSADVKQRTEQKLAAFEQKTGAQVVVLTLPGLEGEAVEDYTQRVAQAWKLGQKGKNNGVLFLVARDDRKMRIEVGYGLEPELTDLESGRILSDVVAPYFRNGDFGGGIEHGVDSILGSLEGQEVAPAPLAGGQTEMPVGSRVLFGLFVFGILGVFSMTALASKGFQSWFLYLFLIPFYAIFPTILLPTLGVWAAGIWIVLFPILKLLLPRLGVKFPASLSGGGGGPFFGGGWGGGGGGGSWGGGGGGGFSGGGGSFGGGGSSGSW